MAGAPLLPDPFPDYLTCPHCGEPEVEMWCYQVRLRCPACGQWFERAAPACLAIKPDCQRRIQAEAEAPPGAAGKLWDDV